MDFFMFIVITRDFASVVLRHAMANDKNNRPRWISEKKRFRCLLFNREKKGEEARKARRETWPALHNQPNRSSGHQFGRFLSIIWMYRVGTFLIERCRGAGGRMEGRWFVLVMSSICDFCFCSALLFVDGKKFFKEAKESFNQANWFFQTSGMEFFAGVEVEMGWVELNGIEIKLSLKWNFDFHEKSFDENLIVGGIAEGVEGLEDLIDSWVKSWKVCARILALKVWGFLELIKMIT